MAQTTSTDGGPYHVPVMVREVVELFAPAADGLVVDATFGGGGHSLALLATYPANMSIPALIRLWLKANTMAAAMANGVPQPIPTRMNPT